MESQSIKWLNYNCICIAKTADIVVYIEVVVVELNIYRKYR